uniref:Cytochrome b5 heme-binding domain-containing protein n=1 Tax=Bionectria ochroleuca TaxID=29856 RepID=A0A8H7N1K1_BIOOC
MSERFSLKDVKDKSTETSGYIVIDGRVYEITDYMSKHPGGDDILTEVLGTDASDAFHEVGHSAEAIEQLKPLLRGILDPTSSKEGKGSLLFSPRSIPVLGVLISIVLALVAIIARSYIVKVS